MEENKHLSILNEYSKEQLVYHIYLADKCGRNEDVIESYELMLQKFSGTLNKNERNIFERQIKLIIQSKQKKLNKLYKYEKDAKSQVDKNETQSIFIKSLTEEKILIENEIKNLCHKVIPIVDNILMKNSNDDIELEIFMFRIKADLFKYLSQVEVAEDYEKYLTQSNSYFKEAIILCKSIDVFCVTYLSTVIAYAKFLINFMKKNKDANLLLNSVLKRQKAVEIINEGVTVDVEVLSILIEMQKLLTD